jgi:hypothetical protein
MYRKEAGSGAVSSGTALQAGKTQNGVIQIFRLRNPSGRRVDSASNRNKYQDYFMRDKGGRCIGLTTDGLEILESQTPRTLRVCLPKYRLTSNRMLEMQNTATSFLKHSFHIIHSTVEANLWI